MDSHRALFRKRMSKTKKAKSLIMLLVIVLAITISQDYLQAHYESDSFYFSESLLFDLFWILVVPIALSIRLAFKKSKTLLNIRSKWAIRSLFVLFATNLHLLLLAFLVNAVSALFLEDTFGFFDTLMYSLANDLYKYLLIYTAISLIPMQKNEKPKSLEPLPLH